MKRVASVALGNYGAIAISVLLSAVLARKLGAGGFGRLALILMAVQVVSNVVFTWSLTGLIRFGAQEFARKGTLAETFWARLGLIAPWLLALIAVTLAEQERVAAYLEIPGAAVWLVLGYVVISQLLLTFGSVFQALEQMHLYAASLYLDKAIVLCLVLLLPATLAGSPVPILVCYAVGSLVVLGWAFSTVDRQALSPMWPSRTTVKSLWRFSAPALISSVIGIAGGQAAIFAMVNHFHSIADLGLYSLASQIAGVLQQIATIISLVVFPRLSVIVDRNEDERVRMLMQHVVPYGLLAMSLLLSVCALLSKVGIPLVFGPAFGGAVPLFTLLAVHAMAFSFFWLFIPFFNAYGLTWTLTGLSAATAVVNLIAAFVLVPARGPQGAAVATVVASSILAVLTLVAAQRCFRVGVLRFALLSMPVVVVAFTGLMLDGAVAYVCALGAMLGSTYAVIVALGLFGSEDLVALRHLGIPTPLGEGLARLFPRQASSESV